MRYYKCDKFFIMRKNIILIVSLVFVLIFPSCGGTDGQRTDMNILQQGAVPDGKTDNTAVIQKTIDQSAETGKTIYFPAGTYLSGSVFLKSNTTVHLAKGAVLKGIPDPDVYPGKHFLGKGFIRIDSVSNVTIEGEGTIDGSGDQKVFQQGNNGDNRPYLVHCRKSRNVVIKDVHLENSAFWTLRLFGNDGVRIDGITIHSQSNWNNDGIDIDSRNVIISNCRIDCDDDAICFKSDSPDLCENVVVTNCNLASNCNLIKFGTSSVGGFKNITVSNCVIHAASESRFRKWNELIPGVTDSITGISGIALEVVDGGMMDQINISNIVMEGIQTPVFIRLGNRKNTTGSLKNVMISHVLATARSRIACCISGVPGFNVENVVIRDLMVNCLGGGTREEAKAEVPENEKGYPENRMFGNILPAYGMYIRHASRILLEDVRFNLMQPDARPAIMLSDTREVEIRGLQATQPEKGQQLIVKK